MVVLAIQADPAPPVAVCKLVFTRCLDATHHSETLVTVEFTLPVPAAE